jgi:hypothetical protein
MTVRQRLAVWALTGLVVLTVGAAAWQRVPRYPRLELRMPVLRLPDPNEVMDPTAGGRPMLLVVVENTPQARPQAGLVDACIVYALPTEARITRFMAAFCGDAPDVIGPVRSVRGHMLDIAADLGAIVVHAGQSEEARRMIALQKRPAINQFTRPAPFWRDGSREMPHNLYTGFDRLLADLRNHPILVEAQPLPFSFSYDAPGVAAGTAAASARLDYGPLYAVQYRYEASNQRYLREQDGMPHLDAQGRQIAPRSVVVVFIDWRDIMVNGAPSSQIDLRGSGRLAILTQGRLVEGRWTRSPAGPLTLADAAGGPVRLPPGPVWVELFPADRPFEVQQEVTRRSPR